MHVAVEGLLHARDQFGRGGRAADMNLLQAGEIVLAAGPAQLSSALAMVGTSDMAVARSSWIRLNTRGGSKRRTITCFTPIMVEACGRPQPLAWNSGMVCSSTPLSS